MKQLGMDLHETRKLRIFFFEKYVEKIQVSLKSDKNKAYMKTNLHFFYHISLNSS